MKALLAYFLIGTFFGTLSTASAMPPAQKRLTLPNITAKVSDAWYTMQAGSVPFGIYHEIIEERNGQYSYKYSLTRYEGDGEYQENIGALCKSDLTPIAFNLNKSGGGATETTDATYFVDKNGYGGFKIKVQGARTDGFERRIEKGTILDVFLPIWLTREWGKLKPGYRGWVNTFAEDPEQHDFRRRVVKFEVKGTDPGLGCLKLKIDMENIHADWCMTERGVLLDLRVGHYHIRKASDEKTARAFVAAAASKIKKSK